MHTTATTTSIEWSYKASATPAELLRHYEGLLREADQVFQLSFDGIGQSIRSSTSAVTCVIRIREEDAGNSVRGTCARNVQDVNSSAPLLVPEAPTQTTQPSTASAAVPKPPVSEPGSRMVEYTVDGTAKFASITLTNGSGGTEQHTVPIPFKQTVFVLSGKPVYLSAQKLRLTRDDTIYFVPKIVVLDDGVRGSIHVAVRANGTILQEATTSAAFGVATASGVVP